MKFRIITVGRGAAKPIKAMVDDYTKRLQRMAPTTIIEIAEERRTQASSSNVEQLLIKEAARIKDKIPQGTLVVPLAITAPVVSSTDFAKKIAQKRDSGEGEICFIIGGPDGLHKSLLNNTPWQLSFGPMTFPHMLVRVMLLEQLYRAMTILERVPYHR
ncbi:MAG: 23S rRNA (pseudouridine(1915)-N(3))-methyltransferase RlmH [Magnetococcales bacterium]|nr:23S rRNA (pseudouridine(1915)-N(3))-methyltransferase RlmH [Magnetococcales bacterium]